LNALTIEISIGINTIFAAFAGNEKERLLERRSVPNAKRKKLFLNLVLRRMETNIRYAKAATMMRRTKPASSADYLKHQISLVAIPVATNMSDA